MNDLPLIAVGAVLLLVAILLIPSGKREKAHFLDRVESPRLRRIAGFAVAMVAAACGLIGVFLLGAALLTY